MSWKFKINDYLLQILLRENTSNIYLSERHIFLNFQIWYHDLKLSMNKNNKSLNLIIVPDDDIHFFFINVVCHIFTNQYI